MPKHIDQTFRYDSPWSACVANGTGGDSTGRVAGRRAVLIVTPSCRLVASDIKPREIEFHMPATSLFTRDELAAAFGLLLPPELAGRWADEWFERFVDEDDLDAAGRFVYRPLDEEEEPPAVGDESIYDSPLPDRTGYEYFRDKSDDDVGEYLMSFSDFHLSLVSLVSPELFERVRKARGDSPARADRQRRQMRRIIAAMRPDATG